ncbi:MAG: metallophosphoesterase family protein [Coprobacillaceae bacterium]
MKILCISDTHLENETFKSINDKYPDMDFYIHCGDSSLLKDDPLLKNYYVVKGNHDDEDFPLEIILTIGTRRCLVVHGHHHNVYREYETLLTYMSKENIDICFHGHTHIPTVFNNKDKYIINPGSVMINRASYGYGTYAIITIEDTVNVSFYHHITHQECTEEVLQDGKETLDKIRGVFKY